MRERLRNWGLYIGIGIGLLLGLVMVVIGFELYPSKSTLRAWAMQLFPPPTSTVVCKIGNETMTLADVKQLTKYYGLAGTGANNEDQTILSLYNANSYAIGWEHDTLTNMVNRLINEQIILHKAEERDLYPLSASDQEALKTTTHRFYMKYRGNCIKLGVTEEYLLARLTILKVETLLMCDVTKVITAPEAEVKAAYDTLLDYEKKLFDKDPSKYISMSNGLWKWELNYHQWGYPYAITPPELLEGLPELLKPGTNPVVVYRPSEYRLIKHLLIPTHKVVDFEVQARTEKDETIMAHAREKKLDDNDYKEMNRIRQEVAQEFLANIKPQADETIDKIRNGAEFNDLIAEVNESTYLYHEFLNMDYQLGPGAEMYLLQIVSKTNELNKVGDIASPIGSQYGYHIIQWVGNVPAGPIPCEEVKGQIEAALLFDERAAAWAAALAQWKEEAKAEIDTGKLPEDLPSIVY